jgi:hypothetical protein
MPRVRAGSVSPPALFTSVPATVSATASAATASASATAVPATVNADSTLHQAVTEWLEDCYRPDGVYAKHITNLTRYICDKSPELRSIRFAIRARAAAFLHFCLRIIAVGAQQGLPVAAAVGAGLVGWRRSWASASADTDVSTTPSSLNEKGEPVLSADAETWSASVASAGGWLGDQVHGVLTLAWGLTGSFLDRSLHLQEAAGALQKGVLQILLPVAGTLLLSVAAYWGTYLFLTLVLQIHTLAEKEHTLRRAQAAFLEESEALVGRTLIETLRPPLLQVLSGLLTASAENHPNHHTRHLILTYSSNYELLRSAIYDELIGCVQGLEFSEILAKNRLSAMYFQELFYLMRNADEEVSRTLFRFNQALGAIEGDPLGHALAGGQQRVQALLADA